MKSILKRGMATFCLVLIFITHINAQQLTHRLAIGDTMPQISFSKNFNKKFAVDGVKDFTGKLTILDFFNEGCLSCIKGMPKMDSLQKKFKDQIQIILITDNSESGIKKLFSRIQLPDLPVIVEDTNYYSRMFPHEGDPLHVWIDKNGIIRAITDAQNATESNIIKALANEPLQFYERPYKNMEFQPNGRLLDIDRNILSSRIKSYSLFFKPLNEQTSISPITIVKDSTGNINRITAINTPLLMLYSLAYSKELFPSEVNIRSLKYNNRIIVKTNNDLDVRYPTTDSVMDEWNRRNLTSYEIYMPEGGHTLSTMQADLGRYTPFIATLETMEKECYVLKYKNGGKKIATNNLEKKSQSYYTNEGYTVINNTLQKTLLPQLVTAFQNTPYPIIDETDYEQPVDLFIPGKISNLKGLRTSLKKYNLSFEIEKRQIQVLVIRDKNSTAVATHRRTVE